MSDLSQKSSTYANAGLKPKTLNYKAKALCPELCTHVLLVDDEKIVRQVAEKMLEVLGCKVTSVSSGNEALDVYAEVCSEIDFVILDQMMPGLSAKETLLSLRAVNPSLPIIVASGFSPQEDIQELVEKESVDFMQKPFNLTELSNKLNRAKS